MMWRKTAVAVALCVGGVVLLRSVGCRDPSGGRRDAAFDSGGHFSLQQETTKRPEAEFGTGIADVSSGTQAHPVPSAPKRRALRPPASEALWSSLHFEFQEETGVSDLELTAIQTLCDATLEDLTQSMVRAARVTVEAENVRSIEVELPAEVAQEFERRLAVGLETILGTDRANHPRMVAPMQRARAMMFHLGAHPARIVLRSDTPQFGDANWVNFSVDYRPEEVSDRRVDLPRELFTDQFGALATLVFKDP